LEAETRFQVNLFDRLERLDRAVMATLAKPDGYRRNGQYCFTRRSRIAREIGVRRDVLNASIRRLTEAGCLRSVYSNVLGCWGLEICVDLAVLGWRAQ
jgi:GTP-sensing pleiotropic transcriptional regulator CodY